MTQTPVPIQLEDAFFTLQEVAKISKFSEDTVRSAIKKNRLRASQPEGREFRISREDFLSWMTSSSNPSNRPSRTIIVSSKWGGEQFPDTCLILRNIFIRCHQEVLSWWNDENHVGSFDYKKIKFTLPKGDMDLISFRPDPKWRTSPLGYLEDLGVNSQQFHVWDIKDTGRCEYDDPELGTFECARILFTRTPLREIVQGMDAQGNAIMSWNTLMR